MDGIETRWKEIAVLKTIPTISLLLLLGISALGQQGQTLPKTAATAPYTIPEDAVRQPNPIKPTPESIALGKKWYGYDCAMCHDKDGDGKGDVGADMKLRVTDLTNPATLKERTDGELFYVIKNGKEDMPPEGTRLKSNELWNLVNYVRSLAPKKAPPDAKTPRTGRQLRRPSRAPVEEN
jgi:mono/diheme cytochrome c family protein